jgi:hypothetical protein
MFTITWKRERTAAAGCPFGLSREEVARVSISQEEG